MAYGIMKGLVSLLTCDGAIFWQARHARDWVAPPNVDTRACEDRERLQGDDFETTAARRIIESHNPAELKGSDILKAVRTRVQGLEHRMSASRRMLEHRLDERERRPG